MSYISRTLASEIVVRIGWFQILEGCIPNRLAFTAIVLLPKTTSEELYLRAVDEKAYRVRTDAQQHSVERLSLTGL
jgi:hypothetical protein